MDTDLAIQRPQRWDKPFGPEMSDEDLERILDLPLFRTIDASQFPPHLALADIIRNDARIVRYRRGDIIVRVGDYGNSVFLIISGAVQVLLEPEGAGLRSGFREKRRSVLGALSQLWRNADMPEVRDAAVYQGGPDVGLRETKGHDARTFISDVDAVLAANESIRMTEDQMFGELAALSRTPRTATVFAEEDAELVELRWQGLRDIRRRDKRFRAYIDSLYRERSLRQHLVEAPFFLQLDKATIDLIAKHTLFETHGDFEWFSAFKRFLEEESYKVVEHEPVVAQEGDYLDGLIMIRSGFGRISQKLDQGHRTVGYVSSNELFGLNEIIRHWRHGGDLTFEFSLRAVGYMDILRVPTALIEKHVLPKIDPSILHEFCAIEDESTSTPLESARRHDIEQSLADFFVDNRIINGTETMLINTDRCVACDDCVRACAAAHNNNPRFVRHGPRHGNLMVANACMHCVDPVCLIGCPTGAISRNVDDGRVLIDDATCIGCGTCADSCPYNNIRLVEVRNSSGVFITDAESSTPILKATKCDMCLGQLGGPACQRACPHDALIRINMRDRLKLSNWINR